jgi:two-component system, NarL family, nitrate/nitrite response regulator NarL
MIGTEPNAGRPIRVVIVEDHILVAEGLKMLLDAIPDIEVLGIVENKADLLAQGSKLNADVVLMDFHLPDGSGAEAAVALRVTNPATAVVFLSADDSEESLLAAVGAGASGYLLKKSEPAAELVSAVRLAAAGEMLISPQKLSSLVIRQRELARQQFDRDRQDRERQMLLGQLTGREREVLSLIVAGLDNKSIAKRLAIGTGTVRAHVQHLLEKLGVHSKLEAAATAIERGLTPGGGTEAAPSGYQD